MPPSPVFVSYSHKDKKWLEDLRTMLAPDIRDGVVDVWWDGAIKPSQRWREEIQAALDSARVAVFLVSPNFLASDFIVKEELSYLLDAARRRRVKILWALLAPCRYEGTPLRDLQALHDLARPLSSLRGAARGNVLKAICEGIAEVVGASTSTDEGARSLSATPIDIDRMPLPTGSYFVGRQREITRLDRAWKDSGTHVLTFVAFGGVGKSTLISQWLDRMAKAGWRGAQRALAWSFYSQGTEDRVTSAESFLDSALRFFGDPDPKAGAPRDRGLRLAGLIRQEKTLLVLDGVEPLQHPPNHPLAGQLKDPGLSALLKSLAGGNPGLCIVTTRERIADLKNFRKTAPQVDLETLSPKAGAELLRQLGVKGRDPELQAASAELGNHALALTLFGNYLGRACGGDVRKRKEVDLGQADERQGGHALRVIRAYARWLGEGRELAILRLLGLFDRPAAKEALAALRARPEIPGLTEPLVGLSEEDWQWSVSSLQEHGFLLPADPRQPGSLDAHPLVRVYFQEELERKRPAAWREGNLRLYEHLKGATPELPETLEAMEPLYTSVLHGCRAGRQQEVMDEVYWRRILRGKEHFSWKKLGAFGSELAALSGLFDRPWDSPSARLSAADQAFVLNEAAVCLRALGRLAEAVPPMQAGLERRIAQEEWDSAARVASNLSELTLTLGEVGRAVAFGEQSVALADKSGDAFLRMVTQAKVADALHQAGRWEESAEAFCAAEALQAKRQPEYPHLYSLPGYEYCDLLLSRGEPEAGPGLDGLAAAPEEARRFRQACGEVREQAGQALEWASQNKFSLLSIALDHLSLGRGHFGMALTAPLPAVPGEEAEADFILAAEHLDRAVEGLRQSGNEDDLPRGLLARAAFHRLRKNPAAATADLSEALEIAERGGMRLHLCDAHLEWARLDLQQGDTEAARKHVAAARKLVNETGYQRREREVAWLETLTPGPSPGPPSRTSGRGERSA
ncbi:MAG TPA: toll/interleukin-1 receptor domain-containing protein [Thermoanaerobaculia bacterium]|nr:toll/interleukin-1 receptor domain-containing protein [Thermoanaerobaculia bacterium]